MPTRIPSMYTIVQNTPLRMDNVMPMLMLLFSLSSGHRARSHFLKGHMDGLTSPASGSEKRPPRCQSPGYRNCLHPGIDHCSISSFSDPARGSSRENFYCSISYYKPSAISNDCIIMLTLPKDGD